MSIWRLNAAAGVAKPVDCIDNQHTMTAELIRLDRPPGDFCLAVSGLAPTLEISKLEGYLRELGGGPLWSIIDHVDSSNSDGRRRWAMAFFYCESDAERCRRQCDGLVLSGRRLSANRLTKLRGGSSSSNHPAAAGREPGIPASKAIDLMNHYVGFNQWSSEVLQLTTAVDDDHNSNNNGANRAEQGPMFVARMRVTIACAEIEVTAEATDGGFGSLPYAESAAAAAADRSSSAAQWERRAQHKKAAVTNALKAALAKLAIIRLPCGKVVVRALAAEAPRQRPTNGHPSTVDSASRKRPWHDAAAPVYDGNTMAMRNVCARGSNVALEVD